MMITETKGKHRHLSAKKRSVSETRAKLIVSGKVRTLVFKAAKSRSTSKRVRTQIGGRPGVMGGDACIGQSRIPVWALVALRLQGASNAELQEAYPTLSTSEIEAALEYFKRNPALVANELRDHILFDEEAEASRQ
ncbi:MAG: hypothetical protein KatS3mg015_0904 [Fimbriimonadales bacterium]|nr:MAG: hypothetical protein KatS3mg015_0904 [Fimbriimonadales bacterium]